MRTRVLLSVLSFFAVVFSPATLHAAPNEPLFLKVTTIAAADKAHDLLKSPAGIAIVHGTGDLLVADRAHHRIVRITPGGDVWLLAGSGKPGLVDGAGGQAQFNEPRGIAIDEGRKLIYVADSGNHVIRSVTFDGVVKTIAGTGRPDDFKQPCGIAVDGAGTVYVADTGNSRIRQITAAGMVTTIAGDVHEGLADGPAGKAQFKQPEGITVAPDGALCIADTKNNVVRRLQNGVVSTFAGTGHGGFVDGSATVAEFKAPSGITCDEAGNLYVADTANHALRHIALNGTVMTLAGSGKAGFADGSLATALFREPAGIVFAGALYVADGGNDAVRRIDAAVTISSIDPRSGAAAGGTQVHLFGAGFVPGATTVTFGSTPATAVTYITSTELLVTAPALGAGVFDVTVTTSGGSATLASAYATAPPPTIAAIAPRKGSIAGGAVVTITGANFSAASIVKFGSTAASSVNVASANALKAITPASAAGIVDVSITTSAGTATQPGAFTYFAPPLITSFTPVEGSAGTVVTIRGANFDPDPSGDQVLFGSLAAAVSTATAAQLVVTVPTGATTGRISVVTAGGTATSSSDFSTATPVSLRISAPVNAIDAGTSLQLNAIAVLSSGGGVDVSRQAIWTRSGSAGTVSATGLVTTSGAGALDVTAAYNGFTATYHVTVNALALPPDPATIAPPLNPTIVTPFVDSTSFLYTGPNAIQRGLTATMDSVRVGVTRGRVITRDGAPVAGVRVTVLGHPEYGSTLTRADGMFDLALNGGTTYTLAFEKNAYLPIQRQLYVPWQNYVVVDDAIMVQIDPVATLIVTNAAQAQVVRGTTSTDANGDRRATLLIPAATNATMVVNGVEQPLNSLTIRATEYTVGESGLKAMPAALPPTSGYTYCVELSADEAVAAGATSVRFSKPISYYLDNFLGFPIGTVIPVGWYDRQRGAWSAAPNGVVIKLLSITNGKADIDSRGVGFADDTNRLSILGIDDAERQQLASLYTPGQTLWRVRLTHFTPVDYNVPLGPPSNARSPKVPRMRVSKPKDDPCRARGSIIECENQVLGEVVPLTGTSMSLVYSSARAKGLSTGRKLEIPASDDSPLPASLKRIEVSVEVAGKTYRQVLPPVPSQTATITWDGTDAYGRVINGGMKVTNTVRYFYDGVPRRVNTGVNDLGFADYGGAVLETTRARAEVALLTSSSDEATNFDAATAFGLGGWSLSAQHFYDPTSRRILFGDGTQRTSSVTELQRFILTTVAGENRCCFSDTTGLATHARLDPFMAQIAVGSDGSVYTGEETLIRRVNRDGSLTSVAGTGVAGFTGDGGPATAAQIHFVDIAIGPDDALYIADLSHRIRRIKDGVITTVAGNGHSAQDGSPLGDGGAATSAAIDAFGVTVGPDNSIYIVDTMTIRRVTPDGIIKTIAGGIDPSAPADSALNTAISGVHITVGPDGSIYMGTNRGDSGYGPTVRRITPDGQVTIVAGKSDYSTCDIDVFGGDGGLATQTCLQEADYVAVDRDGNLYIAEMRGGRVRAVTPDGIMKTIAGHGVRGGFGALRDGGIADGEITSFPWGITTGADGAVYFFDSDNAVVRRLDRALPGYSPNDALIPSRDGSVVYRFSGNRHISTLDAMTGASLLTFSYDAAGRLVRVTDMDGNVTTVERDAAGMPSAIVAPGGQVTKLVIGDDGYLSRLYNPAGEVVAFAYTDGLLRSMAQPNGKAYAFDYDTDGRLLKDSDPAGGFTQLSRSGDDNQFSVLLGTASGRTTTHSFDRLLDGSEQRMSLFPTALRTTTNIANSGTRTVMHPDGTRIVTTLQPDPRFGIHSPLPTAVITAGGLTETITHTRTVQLANESDPLSLTEQTDKITVNGKPFVSVFNKERGTVTSTSPAGRTITSTLDAAGRTVHLALPDLLPIDTTYDHGLVSSITRGNRSTSLAYDGRRRVASITSGGSTVRFTYDDADRLTKQTLPDGRVIAFGYDANGNLSTITPPNRPQHAFTFTPTGLAASYTPPAAAGSGATNFQYNTDRQLTEVDRPDGSAISLRYDGSGRVSVLTFPGDQWTLAYNGSGQLAGVSSSDAAVTYTYEGRLPISTAWSGAVTGSVSLKYDNDFAPTEERVNDGSAVGFAYDADHLLVKSGAMTLSRNAANGLIESSVLDTVAETMSYNTFGEPSARSVTQDGHSVFSQQYARDDHGRITTLTETSYGGVATVFSYAYDDAGRLASVMQDGMPRATYSYDENGNRTTGAAVYDDQDRLVSSSGSTYAYTANGDLRARTDSVGTTSYTYDGSGTLRHVTLATGQLVDYVIDGQGRRIGKKTNGAMVRGWLYGDQLRVVAELDAAGAVVSRFVYASRTNSPDYMIKAGVAYRIISDHCGSPRMIIDTVTGNVAQMLGYDEFGNVTADTNPGFQPFGFAGGLYDTDTHLVHFGKREYDARDGRWLNKDPLLFGGGEANMYVYAGGDPVNHVDPSGLYWTDDAMTVVSNFSAGAGDAISSTATFGIFSTKDLRNWENQALSVDPVDECSGSYAAGKYAGYAEATATMWAAGLNGGSKSVFWSGFQQGARYSAEALGGTTLEQTLIGGALDTIHNGFGWKLPGALWDAASATFAANASEATAVIRAAGATWSTIEKPILAWRGIVPTLLP